MEPDYYNECPLQVGQQLKRGKYTIKKKLGQGGFGITYLATTPAVLKGELGEMPVDVEVVVKEFFMKEECGRASDGRTLTVASAGKVDMVNRYREKFKSEARLLQKMKHPHIVRVVDLIDDENNTVYYVMQYLTGKTLLQKVKPNGVLYATPLPQEQALKYIKQIAEALKLMHSQNMCHLDVKPDNIMLDDKDNAVLIDFGLAKNYKKNGHQMSSMLIGATPGYAPMEQLLADLEDFKPLSDIYSLGATLYFLLTGHTPRPADMHIEKVLPWGQCGISDLLWNAIQQCMQADYAMRPQSIDALLKLLDPPANLPEDNNPTLPIIPTPILHPYPWKRIAYIVGSFVGVALLAYVITMISLCDIPKPAVAVVDSGVVLKRNDLLEKVLEALDVTLSVSDMTVKNDKGELLYTYTGEVNEKGKKGQEPSEKCLPEGVGLAVYPSSDPQRRASYQGGFRKGLREGQGTLKWKNGSFFNGTFENDHLQEGKYLLADSSFFKGWFQDDRPFQGEWYNADGTLYVKINKGKAEPK